jgi:Pyridoxamine 5'-phosphate oxidase
MTDTTSIKHPAPLISGDFTEAAEPFALFGKWFAEAVKSEPNDPNAMSLATVDADGLPDVRMVLMKGYDLDGFVFYSHIASQKGRELAANPKAALLFHWKSLRRQVRIRGNVSPVSEAEADAYFATRPKQAQIGARCRAHRGGAAGGLSRRALSSGTTARSACTTVSNSAAMRRASLRASHGPRCGSIPDEIGMACAGHDEKRENLRCRTPPTRRDAPCS